MMPIVHEGHLSAAGRHFAIAASRFNHFIVDRLIEGAVDAFIRHGGDPQSIEIFKSPGAFELPALVDRVAQRRRFDAIVALGAVIRGATPHFEYVAGEAVKGLSHVSLKYQIPVTFGVLTVDTLEQAIERAGTKAGNKGYEAAVAAIEMANLFARMPVGAPP